MNIFSKRPLLLSLFIFTFFSILCTFLNNSQKICGILIFLILFVSSLLVLLIDLCIKRKNLNTFNTLTLCFLFAFIAFFNSHNFFDNKLTYAESLRNEKNVIAEIKECTYSASYITVYTAKIESINGKNAGFLAEISGNSATHLESGQKILSNMTFSPFSVTNYDYDIRMSKISSGILTSATFEEATILEEEPSIDISSLFSKLRNNISNIIDDSDYDNTSSIIKALLIGDTTNIDAATKSSFSALGISHILSISGTHFTVLLGMIALFLSLIGINKRTVYIILIPLALFYMGLSGFSFSVCRAGIMALISYWSFLCGRQKDSYTALFIALAIILICAPHAVLSISFWLSFTATFTIIVILDLLGSWLLKTDLEWYKKLINYILFNLLITISISFTTLPIVAIYFGYISIISPIANLIIVPLFEIFLYIIPFGVLFSNFNPLVAIIDAYGCWLLSFINQLSNIDNILIAVNQPFVIIIACIGIIVTIFLIAIPLKNKYCIIIPSVLSIALIVTGICCFSTIRADNTFVTYFTTGKSDVIVATDNNKTMCIDISNGSSAAMYYTKAVVSDNYSTEISAYIFTHCRSDHINSFKKLADRMHIRKIYLPNIENEKNAKYIHAAKNAAIERDIEIVFYNYDIPFVFEGCEVIIFEPQYIGRSSHEIISLNISTEKDDFIYLGSSFSDSNFDYTERINDAEYIIFGQHYPKSKNRFKFDTTATLIYGNEDIYALSDINKDAYVLSDGARYDFSLK